MTAAAYLLLAGEPATRAEVLLPAAGVWWADVDCEQAPALAGAAALRIDTLELRGTIDASRSGTHAQRRTVRLVGGAGAWGTLLGAKHYHNDAGVRTRTVIEDAAREAGETVEIEASVASRSLGIDYVRQAGPASRALEDALGTATWWVDLAGVTQVASSRPSSPAVAGSYEVLEHDPRERIVVLALDDLTAVSVGSVLSERLDSEQTVRELTLVVESSSVRLRARCGDPARRGALEGAFRSAVERVSGDRLFGRWRYRVVQLSGDRLELQAVRRDAGLPDVLPISMWPGLAGSHAKLALGGEVLVEFLEGSRAMPVVTGFAGKDGNGHVPDEQTLSVSTVLRLGGAAATDAVALATPTNDRNDDVAQALDTLCTTVPVPNDGGAALQTALKLVWPGRVLTPTAPSDVGAAKVVAL